MTLRRLLVTLLAAVSFVAARAYERWQWPIAGAEAGDSIIYKPQTYIGEELNFYDLFIAAPFDAPDKIYLMNNKNPASHTLVEGMRYGLHFLFESQLIIRDGARRNLRHWPLHTL